MTAYTNSGGGNDWSWSSNNDQNLVTIAQFLESNGYSVNAAAGIAGTVAGESGGNPESVGSGGAGLIGWTPPSKAYPYQPIVTGHPNADFQNQLQDMLYYNEQQGSGAMAALQSAPNPVAAADVYSSQFERPLVPYSDVNPSVANSVYNALSSGKSSIGSSTSSGGNGNVTLASTTKATKGAPPGILVSFDRLLNTGMVSSSGGFISEITHPLRSIEGVFSLIFVRGAVAVAGLLIAAVGLGFIGVGILAPLVRGSNKVNAAASSFKRTAALAAAE
jgi:hypothetical protein